jgi:TonB family protein
MIAATPVESWCNVAVGIVTQAGPNKVAFGLTTPAAAGRASGTLTIFTGSARYDVRFHDVAVPHVLSNGNDHSATPIVVQFPAPVPLDAVVVSSLETANPQPCRPYYSPYSRRGSIGWSHIESQEAFTARAFTTPAVKAPAPQPYAPAICESRTTPPATVAAYEPDMPDVAMVKKWKGDTTVLVTVDVDGRAVDAQTQTSSGHPELDTLAEQAARRSQFTAGTFDCVPIVGTYLFVVSWTPN